jgi:hypothetical protein
MKVLSAAVIAGLVGLAGCVGYHQVTAVRMARPAHEPPELAAYAKPDPNYPSVGGDILRGAWPASPAEGAGDEETSPPGQTPGATPP